MIKGAADARIRELGLLLSRGSVDGAGGAQRAAVQGAVRLTKIQVRGFRGWGVLGCS